MGLVRHKGTDTSLQGKMSPNKEEPAASNRDRKAKEDSEWFRDSATSWWHLNLPNVRIPILKISPLPNHCPSTQEILWFLFNLPGSLILKSRICKTVIFFLYFLQYGQKWPDHTHFLYSLLPWETSFAIATWSMGSFAFNKHFSVTKG